MPFVAAAIILAVVGFAVAWFLRANPSTMARNVRIAMMLLGGLGSGGLLVFGLRFLPAFLPELMGFAGLIVAFLVARAARRASSGGFSTPGSGQRTEAHTAFLDAWIDQASGEMGASVLKGRFAGRTLDGLAEAELRQLHGECVNDQDSLRILEAYLDRRFGTDWRQAHEPPAGPRTDMTRDQALAVLGLKAEATPEEIRAAHRRLIQRVHPDAGGSADLAARINRAKDVLLGH